LYRIALYFSDFNCCFVSVIMISRASRISLCAAAAAVW